MRQLGHDTWVLTGGIQNPFQKWWLIARCAQSETRAVSGAHRARQSSDNDTVFQRGSEKENVVPLPGVDFDPNLPAVRLNHGLSQVQPQPGAFDALGEIGIGPVEAFKNVRQVGLGDAWSLVGDAHGHLAGAIAAQDADRAARRVSI